VAGGWAASGSRFTKQTMANDDATAPGGQATATSAVEPALFNAPANNPPRRVTQTQYAPRVRIRTPQTNTLASSADGGLRRIISDNRAIDVMDLPPVGTSRQ
jgi:hypothetical protein